MKQLTVKNVLLVLSLVLNALQNTGTVATAIDAPPVAAPSAAPSPLPPPCSE